MYPHDTRPDKVRYQPSLKGEPKWLQRGEIYRSPDIGLIEEVKQNNLTAVLCFIDFKKAFDTIH